MSNTGNAAASCWSGGRILTGVSMWRMRCLKGGDKSLNLVPFLNRFPPQLPIYVRGKKDRKKLLHLSSPSSTAPVSASCGCWNNNVHSEREAFDVARTEPS